MFATFCADHLVSRIKFFEKFISHSILGLVNDNYYIFVIRDGGGRRSFYSEISIPVIETKKGCRCTPSENLTMFKAKFFTESDAICKFL